ncbi:hypothetical protein MT325_m554L [Paramecium bursaria chlorella virus MT325]|uniref:Uncharacterized protein m554L n=1 Tax=Paramecium bursaria Chlorella virus MT325 TaxID=346932 RepID=A7IUT4_PBCVM|nr:hypothetical protein MT325_m554L [Paramecium bursaria chlorella virus MT325]
MRTFHFSSIYLLLVYFGIVGSLLLLFLLQFYHLFLLRSSQLLSSMRSIRGYTFLWSTRGIICLCSHLATWFASFDVYPFFIIPPFQRCFLLGRRTACIRFYSLLFHCCFILLDNLP